MKSHPQRLSLPDDDVEHELAAPRRARIGCQQRGGRQGQEVGAQLFGDRVRCHARLLSQRAVLTGEDVQPQRGLTRIGSQVLGQSQQLGQGRRLAERGAKGAREDRTKLDLGIDGTLSAPGDQAGSGESKAPARMQACDLCLERRLGTDLTDGKDKID